RRSRWFARGARWREGGGRGWGGRGWNESPAPPYKRAAMGKIPFLKMHGLGNDFVVLDGRRTAIAVDAATARVLADRRTGIGCDQVILLEPPRHPDAQVLMRILNPDGSAAEACG